MELPNSWFAIVGAVAVVVSSLLYLKSLRNRTIAPPPRVRYEPPKIDCSREALAAEMNATRSRPIEKLPIAVDLPRLARKTFVRRGDETLLDGTDSKYELEEDQTGAVRARLIQDVWSSIAVLVEEESEVYANLHNRLTGGDVSAQLGMWFQENFTDESKVIRILKVTSLPCSLGCR